MKNVTSHALKGMVSLLILVVLSGLALSHLFAQTLPTAAAPNTVTNTSTLFYLSNSAVGNTSSQSIALGDLNDDGYLDAFVGNALCRVNDQGDLIWLNDQTGHLMSNGQELGSYTTFSVALGDIDGDDDIDALTAHHAISSGSVIWYNDGSGNFTESRDRFVTWTSSHQAALYDLDKQNGLDLILMTWDGIYIWLNQGNGIFDSENYDIEIANGNTFNSFVVGDVDKNTYLDIVATGGGSTIVWLQDSSTTFTAQTPITTAGGRSLAMGDLNNDTHLDLFLATGFFEYLPDRVLLNNGDGTFTFTPQEIDISQSASITLGDIDNDNDLDAIVSRNGVEGGLQGNNIWLNDGSAVFTRASKQLGNGISSQIALGDLDNDDDLDAYLGSAGPFSGLSFVSEPDEIWFNSTKGEASPFDQATFLPATWRGPQSGPILLQSFWRASNGYIREVPIAPDGTILWSQASEWAEVDISSLPGIGAIEAQDNLLLDDQLLQSYWRSGDGYVRFVPITNGRVDWGAAEPWQGPINLNELPGLGTVQAQDNVATTDALYQSIWRDNIGWFREVPITGGQIQWGNATTWGNIGSVWSLLGSGNIQAQSNVVDGEILFQSIWRNNSNYVREIPIINGEIQWNNARPWFGPIQDNLYPGIGEIYSWDNVIIP